MELCSAQLSQQRSIDLGSAWAARVATQYNAVATQALQCSTACCRAITVQRLQTESAGISLMDLGSASFVFSNGIVASPARHDLRFAVSNNAPAVRIVIASASSRSSALRYAVHSVPLRAEGARRQCAVRRATLKPDKARPHPLTPDPHPTHTRSHPLAPAHTRTVFYVGHRALCQQSVPWCGWATSLGRTIWSCCIGARCCVNLLGRAPACGWFGAASVPMDVVPQHSAHGNVATSCAALQRVALRCNVAASCAASDAARTTVGCAAAAARCGEAAEHARPQLPTACQSAHAAHILTSTHMRTRTRAAWLHALVRSSRSRSGRRQHATCNIRVCNRQHHDRAQY